jgi:hypothetical protein
MSPRFSELPRRKTVMYAKFMHVTGVLGLGLLMLLACAALQGCGSTVDVASNWSDSAVVIDGKTDEWSSSLSPMKDIPVLLGMRNDQDYLYLCLASSDWDFRRQMMGAGMTIWFEPKSGDRIGIHYPLGMSGMGMGLGGRFGPPGGEMPPGAYPEGGPPDAGGPEPGMGTGRTGNMPEIVKELEILGPGKDDVDRMPVVQATGIEVKIGQSEGSMVYELKIPLQKTQNHPYAIASNLGSKVDISFETGKLTRPAGGPGAGGMSGGRVPGGGGPGGMGPGPGGMGPTGGDGGGPPGGAMPGSGGMGGGRRGGRGGEGGPGGGRAEPKQFKLKTEVTLASGQSNNSTK